MRRGAVPALAAGLAALTLPSGCIPSNVVAEQDRAVVVPAAALRWEEPLPSALAGLYESVAITGEIAAAMLEVYYWFDAGGEFTGAALVLVDGSPRFQTLAGRYRIADGRIWLGEVEEPAALAAAAGHVRFSSGEGTLVLRLAGD